MSPAAAEPSASPGAVHADPARSRELRLLRASVGLLAFDDRGIVRVSGADGATFLQGLVTGDLRLLEPGRGLDTLFLSPTGKVLARAAVFRDGADALLLLLQTSAAALMDLLDRYHFAEDVVIADLSAETDWFALHGPAAPAAVAEALGDDAVPEPWSLRSVPFGEHGARVARTDELGVPGLQVLLRRTPALTPELRGRLEESVRERNGGVVSRETWDVARVEAGLPWMGAELDDSVLPMEAGLHALLDGAKGCYVGQEVVARAQVQGRTNWSLWGVRLPDALDVPRGPRELAGIERPRAVLRLRSVVHDPETGGRIALAFVHREVARPGPLRVRDADGGELEVRLEPLPFAGAGREAVVPGADPVA